MNTIQTQKKLLRQKLLLTCKAIDDKNSRDLDIIEKLKQMERFKDARSICFYVSKNEEINTHVLIQEELVNRKRIIVVPKVVGHTLTLYEVKNWNDLVIGAFGILEPKTSLSKIDAAKVDLFVVPGVAFTREGFRLGRGKGFYDKLLTKTSGYKIGLAYRYQVINHIPQEVHDIKMQVVVTENKVYVS